MQMKDQIGTYSYFPSTKMHVGGFGAINIRARAVIFVPYLKPVEEFTLLISDWWKSDQRTLQQTLDSGNTLPMADALLINGHVQSTSFTTQNGQRYMFRVSNVALTTSINFRIQNHTLTLVETEGSHTLQESYESLDIHVGQSSSFLVNLNAPVEDYFIVASTRFTKPVLTAIATLHYDGSTTKASLPLPWGPTYEIHWSMKQAKALNSLKSVQLTDQFIAMGEEVRITDFDVSGGDDDDRVSEWEVGVDSGGASGGAGGEADSALRADDSSITLLKRIRLVWTSQLHKRFVEVVGNLGVKNVVPKTIMQMMNVEGLTRENVASHLRKYRLYVKRMHGSSNEGPSSSDPLFASAVVPKRFHDSD
ncbi:unnamed protein product [Lactuca virosa]|uniref:HTH myb-type domain-containing protein n=2 Tax=Lactuca virosa TaxID=75947 RepID=A0AAU9MTS7_9ASTR|nr:unnamed protein product [Lactuca virosa]